MLYVSVHMDISVSACVSVCEHVSVNTWCVRILLIIVWESIQLARVPAGKVLGGNYWLTNSGWQIAGCKYPRTICKES